MSEEVDALQRITTHEAVCAERYGSIIERISKLETVMWAGIGGIIVNLLTVTGYLASRVLG